MERCTMYAKVWALAVLMMMCISGVSCKRTPCDPNDHEYYNKEIGCVACDKCPVGYGLAADSTEIKIDAEKGALGCYGCQKCPEGISYSSDVGYSVCLPCMDCANSMNRQTIRSCSGQHNSVCGQCLPDHRDIYGISTYPCQSCKLAGPKCNSSSMVPTLLRIEINPQKTKEEATEENIFEKDMLEKQTERASENRGGDVSWPLILVGSILGVLVFLALGLALVLAIKRRPSSLNSSLQSSLDQVSVEEPLDLRTGPIVKREKRKFNMRIEDERYQARQPCGNSGRNESFDGGSSSESLLNHRAENVEGHKKQQPSVHRPSPRHSSNGQPETMNLIGNSSPDDKAYIVSGLEQHLEDRRVSANHILAMRDIGEKWRDLARKLGLKEVEIEHLVCDYPENEERVHQMLLFWTRKDFNSATVGKACAALKALKRNDIVANLLKVNSESS